MDNESDLTIYINQLSYIHLNDILIVKIDNSSGATVFTDEQAINQEGKIETYSYMIAGNVIKDLPIDDYVVSLYIKRSNDDFTPTQTATFSVKPLGEFSVLSINPNLIQKPVFNDEVIINYEIIGEGIEQVESTFTLDDKYSVTDVVRMHETLSISSDAETARMATLTFVFDVTDPNFVLKSFSFKFGNYISNTRMVLQVDSVTYADQNFNFPAWIGHTFETGLPFSVGSHIAN